MRLFVTGGTGVLGRGTIPLAAANGHEVVAPRRDELNLFDARAVRDTVRGADGVLHLATRIPPSELFDEPEAWGENDRLRTDASRVLVDAAIEAGSKVYVQPTITFIYPPDGPVDESTPIGEVPSNLRSALDAEAESARFAAAGRRGVVLRLGLLFGPGTWDDEPDDRSDGVLHIDDGAAALVAALEAPSGIYNAVADGGRVSNALFKSTTGWRPRHALGMEGRDLPE